MYENDGDLKNFVLGEMPHPRFFSSHSLSAFSKNSPKFTKTPRNVSKDKVKRVGKQRNLFEIVAKKLT